jgi:hypothetical protein
MFSAMATINHSETMWRTSGGADADAEAPVQVIDIGIQA